MAELATDKFISLPKELLLRIRYHTHSLGDHVNFSLTCKTIYTLYKSSFWEYALKVSGWGFKNLREDQEAILKDKSQQLYPSAGLARIVVRDKKPFASTCMSDAADTSSNDGSYAKLPLATLTICTWSISKPSSRTQGPQSEYRNR